MNGLFCGGCKAKNNEEYKLVLKKRRNKFWLLFGVGTVTAALSIVVAVFGADTAGGFPVSANAYQIGLVSGLGVGLMLGCLIAVTKICRTMASEERLKENRLRETDEREIEVANQALQTTAKIILAALYILMIVGGLFSEMILSICTLLIGIFLVSYAMGCKIYGKVL